MSTLLGIVPAALLGGGWVLLSSVLVDRLGSKVGGLIASIPSTLLLALLFIGLGQGIPAAVEACAVMPLAFAAAAPLMLTYASLARRGHGPAASVGGAALVWLAATQGLTHLPNPSFPVSLGLAAGLLLLGVFCLERGFDTRSSPGQAITYSGIDLLGRAGFAGAVVGGAVLLGRVSGPVLGGVVAAFPAVYVSTLYLVHRDRGARVAVGLTKAMLVGGASVVMGYLAAVHTLYPRVGLAWGTGAGMAVALLAAGLVHRLVMPRLR